MLAIVDYAAGNIKSVVRALDFIGVRNLVTSDPAELATCDAVIVPGVGAAGSAMDVLKLKKLDDAIRQSISAGKPYFGICLGLQMLFEQSAEDGAETLGVFKGRVERLVDTPGFKIPHIGWNPVDKDEGQRTKDTIDLLEGIPDHTPFYYVHSYVAEPRDDSIVWATSTHTKKFPAIVGQGSVWAVQFHPEKSGEAGLTLLRNFARQAQL